MTLAARLLLALAIAAGAASISLSTSGPLPHWLVIVLQCVSTIAALVRGEVTTAVARAENTDGSGSGGKT